ncbi:MAG: hypothetical protein AAB263_07150 [Planctomycetota bacterium]
MSSPHSSDPASLIIIPLLRIASPGQVFKIGSCWYQVLGQDERHGTTTAEWIPTTGEGSIVKLDGDLVIDVVPQPPDDIVARLSDLERRHLAGDPRIHRRYYRGARSRYWDDPVDAIGNMPCCGSVPKRGAWYFDWAWGADAGFLPGVLAAGILGRMMAACPAPSPDAAAAAAAIRSALQAIRPPLDQFASALSDPQRDDLERAAEAVTTAVRALQDGVSGLWSALGIDCAWNKSGPLDDGVFSGYMFLGCMHRTWKQQSLTVVREAEGTVLSIPALGADVGWGDQPPDLRWRTCSQEDAPLLAAHIRRESACFALLASQAAAEPTGPA